MNPVQEFKKIIMNDNAIFSIIRARDCLRRVLDGFDADFPQDVHYAYISKQLDLAHEQLHKAQKSVEELKNLESDCQPISDLFPDEPVQIGTDLEEERRLNARRDSADDVMKDG